MTTHPGDPATIGSFAIQARLGRGAMGAVYLARSPGGRLVAVKVVRDELAGDDGFRARFAREIDAARKVSGAFTAAVVDADPDAEPPWLATEYLPGPTLQKAIDTSGPLTPGGVRSLAGGLAEALVAIHRSGLVHRDLKPSNIVLTDNGPRVIDFGIARALEDASLTATGVVVGTPGYLSPEQITGTAIGPPSDMFALGAVLVFAASGRGPFATGNPASLLHRIVNGQPHVPPLPDPLHDLVRRCLARDPADRPTPAELLRLVGSPANTAVITPPTATLLPPTKLLPDPPPAPPQKPAPQQASNYTQHPPAAQSPGASRSAAQHPAAAQSPGASPNATQEPGATQHSAAAEHPLSAPHQAPQQHPAPAQHPAAQELHRGPHHATPARPTGATFTTTRTRPAIIATLTTFLVIGFWPRQTTPPDPVAATISGLVALISLYFAIRHWRLVLRRRVVLHLSPGGLTITRAYQQATVPWSAVTRLRIVGDVRRPWLVAWLDHGATLPAPGRRHHGGYKLYPVAHERPVKRRTQQLNELQAALNWYAGHLHDNSYP
ncbi:protein kinase domain-containing protein [Kribbella sp. CA-247076]|uniref:serine/threonine-protein kinase n=1 Tax=Kribbella sp. CA-247076 TaxID=3239941 RepID=UPI003D932D26